MFSFFILDLLAKFLELQINHSLSERRGIFCFLIVKALPCSGCFTASMVAHFTVVKTDNPPSYTLSLALVRISGSLFRIIVKGPVFATCVLSSISNNFIFVMTIGSCKVVACMSVNLSVQHFSQEWSISLF